MLFARLIHSWKCQLCIITVIFNKLTQNIKLERNVCEFVCLILFETLSFVGLFHDFLVYSTMFLENARLTSDAFAKLKKEPVLKTLFFLSYNLYNMYPPIFLNEKKLEKYHCINISLEND